MRDLSGVGILHPIDSGCGTHAPAALKIMSLLDASRYVGLCWMRQTLASSLCSVPVHLTCAEERRNGGHTQREPGPSPCGAEWRFTVDFLTGRNRNRRTKTLGAESICSRRDHLLPPFSSDTGCADQLKQSGLCTAH